MADLFDLPERTEPKADEAKPDSRDRKIIEWCEDRLKAGQRFVESSAGYDRIEPALDAIFATERQSNASYVPPSTTRLSNTRANLVAKTAEDLTALLTDIEIIFEYSTNNQKYEQQARLANKDAQAWYASRNIGLRIGDVVRYYCAAGTGWMHLYYNSRMNDMMVEAKDPRHVFPIEPISYHTIQDALGVIVRDARTPNWVFGEYNKRVSADIGDPGIFGWFTRTIRGMAKNKHTGPLSPRAADDAIPATPTVFVNKMYLDDQRTNETSSPVFMGKWLDGEPQNQWSYEVAPGQPLYPFKRMIVWGANTLLYDGPSPYWHGKFPLIKLTLNPWPMSWLGKGPLWDIMPLNTSLNGLLRVIDDHAAKLAQPGVVADRNVSRAELNKFNSRLPGYQIRTNTAAGKGIMIQQEPPLQQSLWQHINWIKQEIKEESGLADISQMAQLNQIPSDDTIETIMKAMTPGVRLRSRILEGFYMEFAEQYLSCIAQFDTIAKRIARFGPTAVTKEDFDYKPGSFIPDDMPDGEPGDIASSEQALALGATRPAYERAKQMLMSFNFAFRPGSLLNSAAQQGKMEDLVLSKMGYISWFTVMERLGRSNLVPPDVQIPNSELERLQMQQVLGIGMIANAQGRKATDAAPPSLESQPSGDPTITSS